MGWLEVISNLVSRVPIERVLFPPRDNVKALEDFAATMPAPVAEKEAPPEQETTPTITPEPEMASEGNEAQAAESQTNMGSGQEAAPATQDLTERQRQSPLTSDLPTSEETTFELKRRLAKELYRAQLDLSNKLRIAGKPCDCLESKHTLGLEATAEELIPLDPDNSVYPEILDWIEQNRPKVTIEAISSGQYDNEYPKMSAEFRDFRKKIMGTTSLTAMIQPEEQITLDDAKKMAAEEAAREVEQKWHSQEKK